MDLAKDVYNRISNNYKRIEINSKETLYNIKKVESIYSIYVNSEQIDSVNYSIYIDDIKHQADITMVEHKYISDINNFNEIKLYRDLFKLYGKIIKSLLNIYLDNKVMIIKIWNSNIIYPYETQNFKKVKSKIKAIAEKSNGNVNFNNNIPNEKEIFDTIKKYYYSLIKVHNEIEEIYNIELDDVNKLFNEIYKCMEDLYLSKEFININLIDIQEKTKKGISGQTYIMDLIGKINKIQTEYNNLLEIINSILDIHNKLSIKYLNLSVKVLSDITYEERSERSINNDIEKQSIKSFDRNLIEENNSVNKIRSINRDRIASDISVVSSITESIHKINAMNHKEEIEGKEIINNLDNLNVDIENLNNENINNNIFEDDI